MSKNSHKYEDNNINQDENFDVKMDEENSEKSCEKKCEKACTQNSPKTQTTEENILGLKKKAEQYYSMLQRVSADFDNYKKRSAKEREALYQDVTGDTVLAFLPVLDNFERALKTQDGKELSETDLAVRTGFDLLFRQFKECFVKIGVKEIEALGQKFDPNLHNAVMHVDDESFGEGEIIEELQKGYLMGEKVIRHSMVKVAN